MCVRGPQRQLPLLLRTGKGETFEFSLVILQTSQGLMEGEMGPFQLTRLVVSVDLQLTAFRGDIFVDSLFYMTSLQD